RYDLPLNARVGERFGLFAAAPEDERVAALEPRHYLASARLPDKYVVDFRLRDGRLVGAFARVDHLRAAPRVSQHFWVDKVIVNYNVCEGDHLGCLDRQ